MPKIDILGDKDRYVKIGSTVVMQCMVKDSLDVPFYVFWYREERQLPEKTERMNIQTKLVDGTNDTASNLTIYDAGPEDSGNYTCRPSNLDSTSVQLHVLNGELCWINNKKRDFDTTFALFKSKGSEWAVKSNSEPLTRLKWAALSKAKMPHFSFLTRSFFSLSPTFTRAFT